MELVYVVEKDVLIEIYVAIVYGSGELCIALKAVLVEIVQDGLELVPRDQLDLQVLLQDVVQEGKDVPGDHPLVHGVVVAFSVLWHSDAGHDRVESDLEEDEFLFLLVDEHLSSVSIRVHRRRQQVRTLLIERLLRPPCAPLDLLGALLLDGHARDLMDAEGPVSRKRWRVLKAAPRRVLG